MNIIPATVYGQLAMAAAEAGALGGPPAGGTDCPGRLATRVRSRRAQVSGRGLACSAISDKLEKELLSLIEANHAGAFDRADMHEDVLAAVIRLDESEALLAVEPLYSSCSHIASSFLSVQSDCPLLWTELQLQARRSPAVAERYYALQDEQTRTMARILQRYFEVTGVPLPMDPLDLAAALTALAHALALQRPRSDSGTPSHAGRIVDDILKLLCRP